MDKQRRHVTIACDSCRRQKVRCDCQNPCSACKKASRVCIYSPRRRRGPAPKIASKEGTEEEPLPTPQQGQLNTTFVINYYFRILLGTVGRVFQVADWAIVQDPTVNSQLLSNAKKFQLFAAMANCSRSTGNFNLANKFFEYSRQLARIFYDAMDDLEEPYTVALGFCFMAIYMSATDKKKAQRYLMIGNMVVQGVSIEARDESKEALKFFMKEINFLLFPQRLRYSLSFPFTECYQARQAIQATGSHLAPVPVTVSVTESLNVPTFYDDDPTRLNPYFPIWVNGKEVPNPVLGQEVNPKLINLQVLETLLFIKAMISHYVPTLTKILQQEDDLREEDFCVPVGSFPEDVAQSLIQRLQHFLAMDIPVMNLFGAVLAGMFHCIILVSQERYDEAKKALWVVSRLRTNVLFHDMALTSPAFLLPSMLLLVCYFCHILGMDEEYEHYHVFLRHYQSIGYKCIERGLQALDSIREKAHPNPGTPPQTAQTLHPVGVSPEDSLSNLTNYTSQTNSSPSPGVKSEEATFQYLGDDIGTLLDLSDPEETPMDVLFNFLDPSNEEKVLEELGPLFVGMGQLGQVSY